MSKSNEPCNFDRCPVVGLCSNGDTFRSDTGLSPRHPLEAGGVVGQSDQGSGTDSGADRSPTTSEVRILTGFWHLTSTSCEPCTDCADVSMAVEVSVAVSHSYCFKPTLLSSHSAWGLPQRSISRSLPSRCPVTTQGK